jgi:hypothetical protein
MSLMMYRDPNENGADDTIEDMPAQTREQFLFWEDQRLGEDEVLPTLDSDELDED